MKKRSFLLLLVWGVCFLSFAEEIAGQVSPENQKADLSYAFGMAIASDLKQTGLKFNYDAFTRGFRDFAENLDTWFTLDEAIDMVDTAIRLAMAEIAEINRQEEIAFLAQNAARPGVYTTSSGLQYEIFAEGDGRQPESSDFVRVHYTGFLLDGTVFDSSYARGEPEEFPLQGVIAGWSEGLQLMREGGKSRLFIPSKLAYGTQGAGNVIPPNSVLVFNVELLGILDGSSEIILYLDD